MMTNVTRVLAIIYDFVLAITLFIVFALLTSLSPKPYSIPAALTITTKAVITSIAKSTVPHSYFM